MEYQVNEGEKEDFLLMVNPEVNRDLSRAICGEYVSQGYAYVVDSETKLEISGIDVDRDIDNRHGEFEERVVKPIKRVQGIYD